MGVLQASRGGADTAYFSEAFNYIAPTGGAGAAPTFSAPDLCSPQLECSHSRRQPVPSIPLSRSTVSKLGSHSQQKPNGGGTVIPGSTAINSLTLSANDVEININEDVLSAYDNQDLYLNYLDPTGEQPQLPTAYYKQAVEADICLFESFKYISYQHWNAAYFLCLLTTRPTISSGSTEQ